VIADDVYPILSLQSCLDKRAAGAFAGGAGDCDAKQRLV
jgi:hypothetical protein